jgi:SAM-dependent methyltransferase
MLSRRGFLGAFAVPLLDREHQNSKMFGDAEAYERFMGRWSRLVAPLLVDFAGVYDGARVLDVGSGTGALAFAITKRNGRSTVVGIDPSQEYVAYASSKSPFPDRARFQVGDAQALSFPDAAFDACLSLLVFNFIPDPKKALRDVRRVTKPGGVIAAANWDYADGMRMLRVFWDAARSVDAVAERLDENRMPLCRAGELSELWSSGGLRDIHEQPLEITMRFQSFADYWEPFLLRQGPAGAYAASLNRDRLQALRGEVKHRFSLSNENVPFTLTARAWAVRGLCPASLVSQRS